MTGRPHSDRSGAADTPGDVAGPVGSRRAARRPGAASAVPRCGAALVRRGHDRRLGVASLARDARALPGGQPSAALLRRGEAGARPARRLRLGAAAAERRARRGGRSRSPRQRRATLADRRAGRWAAWFAALSPFLVHHAQEARMYALVATLAAANLLALARFTTGRTARLGALFAVSATRPRRDPLLHGVLPRRRRAGRRPRRPAARAAGLVAGDGRGGERGVGPALSRRRHWWRRTARAATTSFGWFALPGRALVAGGGVHLCCRTPSRCTPRALMRRCATFRSRSRRRRRSRSAPSSALRALEWRGLGSGCCCRRRRRWWARSPSRLVLGVSREPPLLPGRGPGGPRAAG